MCERGLTKKCLVGTVSVDEQHAKELLVDLVDIGDGYKSKEDVLRSRKRREGAPHIHVPHSIHPMVVRPVGGRRG